MSSKLTIAARAGVVTCIAAASLIGAGRLDDALAVFDFRADANAASTFTGRSYPQIAELPGGEEVMEDGRLWMPEDATYRVIRGPRPLAGLKSGSFRYFLLILLAPRTQTHRESAPWVFCYGCRPSTLAAKYQILSDSGHGFVFARRRS